MDELPGIGDRHPVAVVCKEFGDRLGELGDPAMWSASDAEVGDVVRAAETVIRQAQAVQTRAVGEAHRRELPRRAGATGATGWLSGALNQKPARAMQTSRLARSLTGGVEATRAALAAGDIDADQAQVIATAVGELPDEVGVELRGKAELHLLELAGLHHAGVLAGFAGHLLEVIAPELAEARLAEQLEREEARDARRRNRFSAQLNWRGRMAVRGDFDTESWATVAAALAPFTKPAPTQDVDGTAVRDPRSHPQRMADGLVELARRQLAGGELPVRGGKRPHLVVTLDFETLMRRVGLGLLETGVPIGAEAARRIGCDAEVLPAVLGADGVPLDVGRSKRLFDGELREALAIRDRGCAFPGCTRPPSWCDAHHIIHWIDGGATSLANGVLLCGHHHRIIHRAEWTVRIGGTGRPEFIPPGYIDADQRPRINTAHLRT